MARHCSITRCISLPSFVSRRATPASDIATVSALHACVGSQQRGANGPGSQPRDKHAATGKCSVGAASTMHGDEAPNADRETRTHARATGNIKCFEPGIAMKGGCTGVQQTHSSCSMMPSSANSMSRMKSSRREAPHIQGTSNAAVVRDQTGRTARDSSITRSTQADKARDAQLLPPARHQASFRWLHIGSTHTHSNGSIERHESIERDQGQACDHDPRARAGWLEI